MNIRAFERMSAGIRNAINFAAADAPKEKGGASADAAAAIQDIAMLNVVQGQRPSKQIAANTHHTVSPSRAAVLWLQQEVQKAQNKPTMQVVELTPELARALLDMNEANRSLSQRHVASLARDMKNGAWKFNGEPVIVSRDAHLNDGQHRCHAVIESEATVMVCLIIGVERETRDTLDQGRVRTVGDYLSMDGHSDANKLASAAGMLWQYQTFGYVTRNHAQRPNKSEIKRCAEDHLGLAASVKFVQKVGATRLASHSVLAFCHYVFSGMAGRAAADAFFVALIEGFDLKRGDPILYVRNRLFADRKALKASERVELLFRAWNAHRLGQGRTLIRVVGGELPLVEN